MQLNKLCAIAILLALLAANATAAPSKVELRKVDGSWRLFVNQKPFYIKGGGLEFGSQEKLAGHGGNSFRTWRTDNGVESGREVLDRAESNGLYVTMGLDIARERQGFDYNDPAAVARQFADIQRQVLEYKDHPALLMWAIGNELNLNAKNPKVWDAVNDISRMIHRLDPNHPTLTPLSGFSGPLIRTVRSRAPDLDLVGIQMYADIVNLPGYLRKSGYDGAYIVTEWGATGHWEVPKSDWGAPIENDSTTKANAYMDRYQAVIAKDTAQCLGSYVFLWGQKQERTPTWYGMFLKSGEETASVDALHYLWNGHWPSNRSPELKGAWLDGKTAYQSVRLKAGHNYTAKIAAADPDADPLTFRWVVMSESNARTTGGDVESEPKNWPALIQQPDRDEITLNAPATPGAYRLFAYVFDGHGHAAHANIPFYVDKADVASASNNIP
ncbi:MAG TPA: hypothetical protein VH595_10605 [Verrucomicrobiae bacterium]|jgi:hypothetical protein|nr:hypothetical protein [Verrucomicrobiae bacterium]